MGQPERRFKVGACTASVFVNEVSTGNGKAAIRNVSLQKTYKDKEGRFQHTTSFGANEIPKAMLALSKAYEYLVLEDHGD